MVDGVLNKDGRLSKIEEAENEPKKCEACGSEICEEEDMAMCEDISKNIVNEEHVKNAYNEFRRRKDIAPIDFADKANGNHKV